jgi:hypothetical protein
MTKRETTSLLIKLMGVYCLVQFAPALLSAFRFISVSSSWTWQTRLVIMLCTVLVPAIWIVFCLILIRSSDRIARRFYPEDSDASQLTGLGFEDLQNLGYHFIGLLLLVQSFPQIVYLVSSIRLQDAYLPGYTASPTFKMETFPQLLALLAQLAIGLVLFLRPKGLSNLWRRAQPMRYEKADR